jgi:CPA1 family monovalent cation:H+ antiporter
VLLALAGGSLTGIVCAFVVALVMGRTQSGPLEIAATVVLAFLAYLLAVAAGFSGVFATASAALALRGFSRILPVSGNVDDVDSFWSAIAYIANAIVFLATGLAMQPGRIVHHPLPVIVAIAAVVLSRCLLSALVIRSAAWRVTVILAGMRGGLSLALAFALPPAMPFRDEIVDAVFGVVLFTLVVQGLTLEPVLRRLGLQSGSGGPSLSS